MDLTNLTLDELLAQIKSDSGYQQAKAKKDKAEQAEKAAPIAAEPPKPLDIVPETSAEPLCIDEPSEETDEPQEEITEEYIYTPVKPTEPLGLAESEGDNADFESLFTVEPSFEAPAAPQPLALAEEESADEALLFGGYNFSSDINALFPTVTEDNEQEPLAKVVESAQATEEKAAEIKSAEPTIAEEKTVEVKIPQPQSTDIADGKTKQFKIDENSISLNDIDEGRTRTIVLGDTGIKNAIFERPGIVTGRKLFEKTGDLSALHAILPADEALNDRYQSEEKTFVRTGSIPIIAQQKSKTAAQDDGQMILPGFCEPEEPIEHVDEEKVEIELKKNRSKKIDSFRLDSVDEDEPRAEEDFTDEIQLTDKRGKRFSSAKTRSRLNRQPIEYKRNADRAKVGNFLLKKHTAALIGAIICTVCTVALIFITAVTPIAEKIDLNYVGDTPLTYVLSAVLAAVALIAGLPSCAKGIACIFTERKPNAQTPVFICAVFALIQSIVAAVTYSGEDIPTFAVAASFVLTLSSAGTRLIYTRILANFEFLISRGKEGLYSIRSITNRTDADKIAKNIVMGDADIKYSGKVKFADNFLAYSFADDSADDLAVKLVPIISVAAAIIGIIAGIKTQSFLFGFSIFSGALCMGAPASMVLASNLSLIRANKKMKNDGAIITSYAAAFEYESTNAIAVDASDLFPGSFCNIHGMKPFYGVRPDEAILTAASMIIAAGGPISSLFNDVVMGRKELLMNVEELTYEDKLGLSGWIRGRRIFVGNRKLLENHNIEIPMNIDEAKYRHNGRRVIYLADSGKIAAIFVVSYGSDKRIADYLRKIESNGISILVRTTDSNITEEFIANGFGIPLNSVKVVSSVAGETLKSYTDAVAPKTEAKLLHSGSSIAFLHAVSIASSLCSSAGVINTQQTFCTTAGLLLMLLTVLFGNPLNANATQVLVCQAVWLLVSILPTLLRKE